MVKKGISLTFLIVSVVILVIIMGTVTTSIISLSGGINYIQYNKTIQMLEKEARKANLKGETYGIQVSTLSSSYQDVVASINNMYSISLDTTKYYLLRESHLNQMGIKKIKDEYFINYEKGVVFSVQPFTKENVLIYTTQDIN